MKKILISLALALVAVAALARINGSSDKAAEEQKANTAAATGVQPGTASKKVDEAAKLLTFQAPNAPLDPKVAASTRGGACYLQRPPGPRTCVNDVTYAYCARAAQACGCTWAFAAGQSCP